MFPALMGNDFVYLNSGGSGPPSRETIRAMREAAARLTGVDPDDIALTQSTTHGMNLGAFALDWRAGDEIVSSRSEHPGCLVPLHALEKRHDARLRLVEPPITAEKVAEAMTSRTRLVSISHVDWATGEVLPLVEISALARDRGALSLVDGAQSVGNIPVDIPATGADMYAFTGHKWLLGPEGMGAFYVRPGLPVFSPNVGLWSLKDPTDFDIEGGYELRS